MNRTMKPAVSVCMPVYNRAAYIEECVESILAQTFTDFELVIVDDGSTDGTCGLIRSFRDPRIRLIRGTHDYIASCNRALDEARGKYVARMDSDDLMMPDRLRLQYDYLEAHPGVDILGGDMRVFGEGEEWTMTYPGEVDVRSLYERGSGLAHPTVMMRRESIDRLGIRYERPYIYAEDYAFWARAAMQGLVIRNLPEVLVRYRLSHSQATFRHAREQARAVKGVKNLLSRWMAREEEAWARENPPVVPRTDNKLTVIIPFLNEKEEVAETVRSIREHVGMEVDILVINDQSNDGYDYRGSLRPYGVTYVYNIERKGVAASRDYGVSLCRTPYFLLLDAHMRFYDDGWHRRIARLLDEDDRCLLCCQTRFLGKKDGEVYLMEDCPVTYGACLQFNKKGYMPGITWNCREHDPQADIEPIEAVLGAGYAASKRYWQRIRGLEGLMYYGSDEAFLSLKVWGEGGRCLLLKDTVIGHIYRDRSPYKRFCEEEVYNYLFIADVLFPASLRCMAHAVALSVDSSLYAQAVDLLRERKERNGRLREEIAAVMENPVALLAQKEVPLDGETAAYVAACLGRLEEFGEYVKEQAASAADCGLFAGKAAAMVWMYHYAAYSRLPQWKALADALWDEVAAAVEGGRLDWTFRSGLCGIGWAVLYLCTNRLTDRSPDRLLAAIDRQLQAFRPSPDMDTSLATGLGGYWAYRALSKKCGGKTEAASTPSLKQLALQVITADNELTANYYALLYALLEENAPDGHDLPPNLNEWSNAPLYLPADRDFWDISLAEGCLGATIQAMKLAGKEQKNQSNLTIQ